MPLNGRDQPLDELSRSKEIQGLNEQFYFLLQHDAKQIHEDSNKTIEIRESHKTYAGTTSVIDAQPLRSPVSKEIEVR